MKKQILFVDDEVEILDSLKRLLYDKTGVWDMKFVTSAKEALEQLTQKQYDVVILDVKMPGQSGLELLSILGKNDRYQGVQKIVLTGIADQSLKRKALDLGATDMLNKPAQKEELLARINSVLRIKSYYDDLQAQNIILEEQLLRSQRMELVGVLASGAVHDLNNILTIIKGQSDLVLLTLKDPSMTNERINSINLAVYRASRIVEQILNFARQTEVTHILCDVGEIINESLKLLKTYVPNEVTIEWDGSVAACKIYADSTQIYQLLMNLYINAIQAVETEGVIRIVLTEIELELGSRLVSSKVRPGLYVKLDVSDTGKGMDQATLKRIFYPTKHSSGGTGLGLSVVQRIVQNHRGLIMVESELGKGTTFIIYLPCTLDDNIIEGRMKI